MPSTTTQFDPNAAMIFKCLVRTAADGPWVAIFNNQNATGSAAVHAYELNRSPEDDGVAIGTELDLTHVGEAEDELLDGTSIGGVTFQATTSDEITRTFDTSNPENKPGHPVQIDGFDAPQSLNPAGYDAVFGLDVDDTTGMVVLTKLATQPSQ